ncbi:MAG: hypothetical protein AAF492_03065, partial [Verrucomicrobiota bacterium]
KAVETLARAMERATRPEEKKMVIGHLSGVPSVAALDLTATFIGEENLKAEASAACARIVLALHKEDARERIELIRNLAQGHDTKLAEVAERKLLFIDSDTFIQVNFQPENCEPPPGYVADTGRAFGDRGNGFMYGWDKPNDETRDRETGREVHYDTLNHFKSGRFWEISVPNGPYWLRIVSGDATHTDQVNHLEVEGRSVEDKTKGDRFDEFEVSVNVKDERLTVKPSRKASNPKICFIELRSLKK